MIESMAFPQIVCVIGFHFYTPSKQLLYNNDDHDNNDNLDSPTLKSFTTKQNDICIACEWLV